MEKGNHEDNIAIKSFLLRYRALDLMLVLDVKAHIRGLYGFSEINKMFWKRRPLSFGTLLDQFSERNLHAVASYLKF